MNSATRISRLVNVSISALVLATGLLVGSARPVQAAITTPLLLPFSPGFTWYVCQGYESTWSHTWGSKKFPNPAPYALDLTLGSACDATETAEATIEAPWRGTVSVLWGDGICIDIGDGSVELSHITPWVKQGDAVTVSQQIGEVNPPKTGPNGPIAHLHLEAFAGPACDWGAQVQHLPFSGSARMQCAPDLSNQPATSTPGGEWNGQTLFRPSDAQAMFGTPFRDICGSPHGADIKWVVDRGIANGCDPQFGDRYCPAGHVTRGEMAAFMVRLYGYPTTTHDYFSDDDGQWHETYNNALAAQGVTKGCVAFTATTRGQFCPWQVVPRGMAAALLSRSEHLPATANDYYWDDNNSPYQDAINRMTAAGLMKGCAPGQACPDQPTTREQMATFLRRAGERSGEPPPTQVPL